MPVQTKTAWHGFTDWLSFLRATVALLVPILGGMWALGAWGVDYLQDQADDRYVQHAHLDAAVVDIKKALKAAVAETSCQALIEDMSRLEQTIRYKRSKQEDIGLEVDLLAADQRALARRNGCVEQ